MYLSARLRGAFWQDIVHLALEGSAAQRPAWPRVQTLRFRFMFDVSFSRLCIICPPIILLEKSYSHPARRSCACESCRTRAARSPRHASQLPCRRAVSHPANRASPHLRRPPSSQMAEDGQRNQRRRGESGDALAEEYHEPTTDVPHQVRLGLCRH